MNGTVRVIKLPHVRVALSALRQWPVAARRAAKEVLERYGEPNEARADRLVWHYNSPWKRTVVYRYGKLHHTPYPHTDVLEQVCEYRVPPAHVEELRKFSSAVAANGAREELVACADSERTNRMLLNLAHDILIGVRTAKEAQDTLRTMAGALRMNWPEEYAEQLHFEWNDMLTDSPRRRYLFTRQ